MKDVEICGGVGGGEAPQHTKKKKKLKKKIYKIII